jgi:peptide/nickel transport system substrate-binding protein
MIGLAKRRSARLVVAALAASAFILVGLATTAFGSGVAGTGTVVVYTQTDYTDWDFQARTVTGNAGLSQPCCDTLIAFGADAKPGVVKLQRFVPYLADSWKVTPKSVTFHLRKGPKCQDGTPITPTVVLNSFKRLLDVSISLTNHFAGTQGGNGQPPTGTGPYLPSADEKAGTFTFRASQPNNELLNGFNSAVGSQGGLTKIVCPSGLANPDNLKNQMYGSGPYRLVSAVHADKVVYQLWPDWTWGPNGTSAKKGMADTLVFRIISNPTTAVNLAITGDIDVIQPAVATDAPRLEATGNFTRINAAPVNQSGAVWGSIIGMYFNVTRVPDLAVRTALLMVLDRKTYLQATGNPYVTPISSTILPTAPCYNPAIGKIITSGTLDQARAVLQKAGYTYHDSQLYKPDGSKLTIEALSSNANTGGNAYVYDQWSKLGVDVNAQFLDSAVFGTRAGFNQYDVVVSGGLPGIGRFIGDGYPTGVSLSVVPPGPVRTRYEREVRLALATTGAERCRHWDNVARYHAEQRWDFPWSAGGIPVYVRKGLTATTWGGLLPNTTQAVLSLKVASKIRD